MSKKSYFKFVVFASLILLLHSGLGAQTCEGPLSIKLVGSTTADSISVLVDATGITCTSDANGSFILHVDGGNPDYNYSWEDDITITDSVRYELIEGAYTVTVTDSEGCTEVLSLDISALDPSNSDLITEDGCGVCWIEDGEITYFFSPDTKYIAAVSDQPNDMLALATTEVCVYLDDEVNTCNNNPYLQRYWSVDPDQEEVACIKLFFTQEELEALAASAPGESVDFQTLIDDSRLCLTAWSGGNERCGEFESEIIYSMAASPPLVITQEDPIKKIWSVEVCTNEYATFYLNICEYPLPVELVYFEGEKAGDENSLSWKTASEFNTSHFELERSSNGFDFNFLAKISAAGNSNQLLNYTYLDKAPSLQRDYYRLKIIDFDETFAYSNIIVIQRMRTNLSKIYPTIFDQQVYYETVLEQPDELEVIIFDVTGRIAHYQNFNLSSGPHKLNFNLDRLSPGSYFFQINWQLPNVSEGYKLVKYQ